MSITLSTEGRRIYVVGNTYPIKDQLRSSGCKWDSASKRWWAGTTKRAELEALVAGAVSAPAAPREEVTGDNLLVKGRATYQGKTYYLVWAGATSRGHAVKLAFRDGSKVFWARDAAAVSVVAEYARPKTIGSLREYAQRAKETTAEFGSCECAECGRRSTRLIDAADSSGLVAGVCGRCAAMPRWERSYA